MHLENAHVASIFHEMADLLEIQGESAFRIRAFRRVGQALENLPGDVGALLQGGSLTRVPGIGQGSIARIREILATGECKEHLELKESMPQGLLQMLRLEGVGPMTVRQVHAELGIGTVDELEAAARAGRLAGLPRMGERSQAKLLRAIESFRRHRGRVLLAEALPQGEAIVEHLLHEDAAKRADLAGSSRRRCETVGDLDVLVASEAPAAVMDRFVALPQVHEVAARGETKCSVKLRSRLQVDLRVVGEESFGAALHYFTGSKMHNIAIRERGRRLGLRINEYGVFAEQTGERVGGETEEEVFSAVGLPFIPPELRESSGEIEAAEQGSLPRLLTQKDLRGDLHTHTTDTDGQGSIEQMARAAIELGHEYIAITDHSQSLTVARGLTPKRLQQQVRQVRELQQNLGAIRLLAGIEVDILPDGSLDLPLGILKKLDWVIASVHSHFAMDRSRMTARIVRALESGVVDCLGHPTGRLLGQRDGYAVDLDPVLRAAARLQVCMELNAFPERLDLDAAHCRQARDLGVPVAVNTDAHVPWQLGQQRFGIFTARRGWLRPSDVLNTRPAEKILAWRAERKR